MLLHNKLPVIMFILTVSLVLVVMYAFGGHIYVLEGSENPKELKITNRDVARPRWVHSENEVAKFWQGGSEIDDRQASAGDALKGPDQMSETLVWHQEKTISDQTQENTRKETEEKSGIQNWLEDEDTLSSSQLSEKAQQHQDELDSRNTQWEQGKIEASLRSGNALLDEEDEKAVAEDKLLNQAAINMKSGNLLWDQHEVDSIQKTQNMQGNKKVKANSDWKSGNAPWTENQNTAEKSENTEWKQDKASGEIEKANTQQNYNEAKLQHKPSSKQWDEVRTQFNKMLLGKLWNHNKTQSSQKSEEMEKFQAKGTQEQKSNKLEMFNVKSSVARRLCITGIGSQNVVFPCKNEQLGPRFLPPQTSIIRTSVMPFQLNLFPEIGNGHVATVVQSNTIYMNGLYNGANVNSHRARIPSTAAVLLTDISPDLGVLKEYQLDLDRGVFTEVSMGNGFNIEVRRYAHRELTRLLVTEVVITRSTCNLPIILTFDVDTGPSSNDINFVQQNPGIWIGQTKMAEYPQVAGTLPVAVVYSVVPANVTFAPTDQGSVVFFTSVSPNVSEAMQYYDEGVSRLTRGTLFSSHVSQWESLWQQGGISLIGNDSMALTTNAALYYLLSALPLQADLTWPFVGMSPGGLAHGAAGKDYQGHVFWDQDTWMFPGIALLHADLGRIIVGSRLRTLSTAQMYAKMSGLQGARYPWESAFTGLNASPSNATAEYELHVTGDCSWMMRQYLQLTNDTSFLLNGGYQAIADMADFWVSRSTYGQDTKKYEIKGVMGPDEYHWPVNNSIYTNVIAQNSMRTAQFAAQLIGQTSKPQWETVASDMFFAYDPIFQYHPEFDNYTRGDDVKQADVILLNFPLKWNMTGTDELDDLAYYASVTPGGPAMTWGIFAIDYLRLGEKYKADVAFYKGTWNVQNPFQVWAENADGSGAYNFHTGMGGYLQSLLFGYLGVDLNDDSMGLNPQLPPSLTAMAINGLDYVGNSLNVAFNENLMNITLTKAGWPLLLTLKKSNVTYKLNIGTSVSGVRQPAVIAPQTS